MTGGIEAKLTRAKKVKAELRSSMLAKSHLHPLGGIIQLGFK
jgi:hypothetical protein